MARLPAGLVRLAEIHQMLSLLAAEDAGISMGLRVIVQGIATGGSAGNGLDLVLALPLAAPGSFGKARLDSLHKVAEVPHLLGMAFPMGQGPVIHAPMDVVQQGLDGIRQAVQGDKLLFVGIPPH